MYSDSEFSHGFRFLSDILKEILEKTRIFFQCFFVFFLIPAISQADGLSSKWSFATGYAIRSSAAFGADGFVYAGSDDGNLYAYAPDGSKRVLLLASAGQIVSSPAIGADGTIYVGSGNGYAYSVLRNGTQKRQLSSASPIVASPAIAPDGAVYVGSEDGYLYSVGSGGNLRWKFLSGAPILVAPIVSSDGGTIYAVSGRYLHALRSSDGFPRWETDMKATPSAPALDADGTIYIGTDIGYVYAMNPSDGTVKTSFKTQIPAALSPPVISGDGTLYVGSADHRLYAFDLDGIESNNRIFETDSPIVSSPAIGSDGTIYVVSGGTLYAFGPGGNTKQTLTIGESVASPLIGPDGTIYIGTATGYLLAINSFTKSGLATSPWPMFGHDMRHTGRNSTDQFPKASAGGNADVLEEDRVTLDGSGSTDPDYGIFTYYWEQTGGISVLLENATSMRAAFTAPKIQNEQEILTFRITVTDSHGQTSTDTCEITVSKNDYTCFIGSLR